VNGNCRFNTVPYHARPLARNMVNNAVLKALVPDYEGRISTTLEPIIVEDDVSATNGVTRCDQLFISVGVPMELRILRLSFRLDLQRHAGHRLDAFAGYVHHLPH